MSTTFSSEAAADADADADAAVNVDAATHARTGAHADTVPAPLLRVRDLAKHYRLPRTRLFHPAPVVPALRGVSFDLHAGASLGLVGESGSGKSTLARLVMALEPPSAGSVQVLGRDLNALDRRALRAARRDFQMVFQDPFASLDPRQRVGRIVAEPLMAADASATRARVAEALDAVGLHAADAAKYPHEFSGGQRQRIAIARALITRPRLIVADEPVSALDVSVQAQILNLFADLQQHFGVTCLFISHDLAVVDQVCSQVAVMHAGRIVEQGPAEALFGAPAHPYTRALLASHTPAATPGASARVERPPAAPQPEASTGCSYASQCAQRVPRCGTERPLLRRVGVGRLAACHIADSANPGPEGEAR